jgi:hypothetical protein
VQHQWFDDLTRALADGVSRREGLKLLASGLAGGLLPQWPSRALADDRPTHPDWVANSFELLSYQDIGYRFRVIPIGAEPPSNWARSDFDDSEFDAGDAAFGSGRRCLLQSTVTTRWPTNSRLLLRHVVSVSSIATNLRVMVAVDNDIEGVFFNGTPLVEHTLGTETVAHHNCPVPDEFRFDVPSSLVTPGDNVIALHVLDSGDESFVDIRVIADAAIQALTIACNDSNTVSLPCDQLRDYVSKCGVICPDGSRLPRAAGCTSCGFLPERTDSPFVCRENALGQQCASSTVNIRWVIALSEQSIISYEPSEPPCCPQACAAEIERFEREARAHEAIHQANFEAAVARANRDWAGRRFIACAPSCPEARRMLFSRIAEAQRATENEIGAECEKEPLGPTPQFPACGKCVPARSGQRCVDGRCQEASCERSSRCPTAVDCSRKGQLCLCLRTAEGNLRCGRSVGPTFCRTATPCVTSASCEGLFGRGWFCQEPGTGCCGCVRHPQTGQVVCGEAGVCVPPC